MAIPNSHGLPPSVGNGVAENLAYDADETSDDEDGMPELIREDESQTTFQPQRLDDSASEDDDNDLPGLKDVNDDSDISESDGMPPLAEDDNNSEDSDLPPLNEPEDEDEEDEPPPLILEVRAENEPPVHTNENDAPVAIADSATNAAPAAPIALSAPAPSSSRGSAAEAAVVKRGPVTRPTDSGAAARRMITDPHNLENLSKELRETVEHQKEKGTVPLTPNHRFVDPRKQIIDLLNAMRRTVPNPLENKKADMVEMLEGVRSHDNSLVVQAAEVLLEAADLFAGKWTVGQDDATQLITWWQKREAEKLKGYEEQFKADDTVQPEQSEQKKKEKKKKKKKGQDDDEDADNNNNGASTSAGASTSSSAAAAVQEAQAKGKKGKGKGKQDPEALRLQREAEREKREREEKERREEEARQRAAKEREYEEMLERRRMELAAEEAMRARALAESLAAAEELEEDESPVAGSGNAFELLRYEEDEASSRRKKKKQPQQQQQQQPPQQLQRRDSDGGGASSSARGGRNAAGPGQTANPVSRAPPVPNVQPPPPPVYPPGGNYRAPAIIANPVPVPQPPPPVLPSWQQPRPGAPMPRPSAPNLVRPVQPVAPVPGMPRPPYPGPQAAGRGMPFAVPGRGVPPFASIRPAVIRPGFPGGLSAARPQAMSYQEWYAQHMAAQGASAGPPQPSVPGARPPWQATAGQHVRPGAYMQHRTQHPMPPPVDPQRAEQMLETHRTQAQMQNSAVFGEGDEDEYDPEAECCVCLEATSNVVLVPCGHVKLCSDCLPDILAKTPPTCPYCRGVISDHKVLIDEVE